MKLTESKLREIIRNTIAEAISRDDARLANTFIKQDKGNGFSKNRSGRQGLMQQLLNTRTDVNGQMDMGRSAQEIQGLIQKYSAELKKLRGVYTYLNNRAQNADYKRQGPATQMDPARKQKMLATRQANDAIRKHYGTTPNWSVKGYGSVDNSKLTNAKNARSAERNANVNRQPGGNWISENMDESFFGNLFKKNNQPDEVDQILATYKRIPQPEMAAAAQKVGERIREYNEVLTYLKGMLKKWQDNGDIYDANAQARSQALRKQKGSYKQVAESIDRIVAEAIRKYVC